MSTIEETIEEAVTRAVDRHMGAVRALLTEIRQAQPPRFLTIGQAAEAMACHPNTVRRMVKAGQLVYKHVGLGRNGVRIDASSLHVTDGGVVQPRRASGGRR